MHVSVPVSPGNINASRGTDIVSNNLAQERCWLEHCHSKLDADLTKVDYISWGGYHASLIHASKNVTPAITSLMLCEKSTEVSMHGKAWNGSREKCQIPVIACDQPIFAIAKYVKWK